MKPPLHGWLAAAIALLASLDARGQVLNPEGSLAQRSRSQTLPNGLRVLVIEDRSLPLVSIQLWLRAGSVLDPPGRPGWAEMMRHVIERGRASAAGELPGALCASETLPDAMYWARVVPATHDGRMAQGALRELAGLLRRPPPTAEAMQRAADETLRNAVRMDGCDQALRGRLFAGHGYGHSSSRASESLRQASIEDAGEFLEHWCVSGNAQLVLAGDIGLASALELAKQAFGQLPAGAPPRRGFHELAAGSEWIRASEAPDGSIRFWRLQWATAGLASAENAAVDVLLHYLFNDVDGLMRETKPGGPPTRWRREAWDEAGILEVDLPADVSDPAEAMDRALTQATQEPPGQARFFRARQLAVADLRLRESDFTTRAWDYGRHEVVGGDVLLSEFAAARLERLPAGAMQDAARYLLRARRAIRGCNENAPASPAGGSPRPPALRFGRDATAFSAGLLNRPAVEIAALPDGGSVRLVRLDGVPGFELALDAVAPGGNREQFPAGFLPDYLSSRGMRMTQFDNRLRIFAASSQLSSAIEIASRFQRRSQNTPSPSSVAIVGDVELPSARSAIETYWRGPGAAASTTSPEPGRIEASWHAADGAPRVSITLSAAELWKTATGYFTAHVIATDLLKRLGPGEWSLALRDQRIEISAVLDEASIRAAANLVATSQKDFEWKADAAQAQRLESDARFQVVLSLARPGAICDALLAGATDPWDPPAPSDLPGAMKQAWAGMDVRLEVFGGSESLRDFVTALPTSSARQ